MTGRGWVNFRAVKSHEVGQKLGVDYSGNETGSGTPFQAIFDTAGAWSVIATVPAGQAYTITDVVIGDTGNSLCKLRVNGGAVMFSSDGNHAFATGLELAEGDVLEGTIFGTTCLVSGRIRSLPVP